jgi:hypothetical protein
MQHFALEPFWYPRLFGSADYMCVRKIIVDEGAEEGDEEGKDEAPPKVDSENVERFIEKMVALPDED